MASPIGFDGILYPSCDTVYLPVSVANYHKSAMRLCMLGQGFREADGDRSFPIQVYADRVASARCGQ